MSITLRIGAYAALAMIAFAANSVLGRLGLESGTIGAGSFALIRLLSGSAMLAALVLLSTKGDAKGVMAGSCSGGVALLVYAGFFSYAYLELPAGTGAVILFAVVQVTMLGWAIIRGQNPSPLQWAGFGLAIGGLIWLVSPGIEAPSLIGTLAMSLAGIGWGIYSLLGRSSADPTQATAGNFIRASAIALICAGPVLLIYPERPPASYGIILAVISGAITSGLGYAIWYAAAKGLSITQAGIVQLSVPSLAALGGVMFLAEPITFRFIAATSLILAGVALALLTPAPKPRA